MKTQTRLRSTIQIILISCILIISLLHSLTFSMYITDIFAHSRIEGKTILLNDRDITLHSPADIDARRASLIRFLWGKKGFPRNVAPTSVTSDVCHTALSKHYPAADPCSFGASIDNLVRIDQIETGGDTLYPGLAYHFVPQKSNNTLVIVHQGHYCYLNDRDIGGVRGIQESIAVLVADGYGVLAVYMPLYHPVSSLQLPHGICTYDHSSLFSHPTGSENPLAYFLDPTAISLNYIKTASHVKHFPDYHTFDMIGLSGGGWTTTLYAAIDPSIHISISVAGSLPLYMRVEKSIGDIEQTLPAFYQSAGYPDLYVMGSYGKGRRQIQILNRHDTCCFGDNPHMYNTKAGKFDEVVQGYEQNVNTTLNRMGQGHFSVIIDEQAPVHQISSWAIRTVILPQLAKH